MDIITDDDLASYLRLDPTPSDDGFALIVELANGIVSEALGDPADDYEVPTRVKAVTLEIAARAWRNPDGYSSETIDDYTYRRDADTRQAGVYLTEDELARLVGYAPQVRMGWLA